MDQVRIGRSSDQGQDHRSKNDEMSSHYPWEVSQGITACKCITVIEGRCVHVAPGNFRHHISAKYVEVLRIIVIFVNRISVKCVYHHRRWTGFNWPAVYKRDRVMKARLLCCHPVKRLSRRKWRLIAAALVWVEFNTANSTQLSPVLKAEACCRLQFSPKQSEVTEIKGKMTW